jgi:hypothetical protein
MSDASVPATRALQELVRACEVVADEAAFQAYRIKEHVTPRTESEAADLARKREDYIAAERTIRRLFHYHRRRLERLQTTGTLKQDSFDQPDAADDGKAQAFTDDTGSPA